MAGARRVSSETSQSESSGRACDGSAAIATSGGKGNARLTVSTESLTLLEFFGYFLWYRTTFASSGRRSTADGPHGLIHEKVRDRLVIQQVKVVLPGSPR